MDGEAIDSAQDRAGQGSINRGLAWFDFDFGVHYQGFQLDLFD